MVPRAWVMWCEQVCVCPQCGHQIGWMFEPEDGALAGLERPSEEGFIAVIVNKADVKRDDDNENVFKVYSEPLNISWLK